MVPGHQAEQAAPGEIVARLGVRGRRAELGVAVVARAGQRAGEEGDTVQLAPGVVAFVVGIEVHGREVLQPGALLGEQPFQHRLQVHTETPLEGTGELAAAEPGQGDQRRARPAGALVDEPQHGQQAPPVELIVALRVQAAVARGDLGPVRRGAAAAVLQQRSRGEHQGGGEGRVVRGGRGVAAVVEHGDRHGHRNVTEQAEFDQVPVRAVAGHRAFSEYLRPLGGEHTAEQFLGTHRGQVRMRKTCLYERAGSGSPGCERLPVVLGAGQGFGREDDGVAGCGGDRGGRQGGQGLRWGFGRPVHAPAGEGAGVICPWPPPRSHGPRRAGSRRGWRRC